MVASYSAYMVNKLQDHAYMTQVEQKIVAELRKHGLLATPQQPQPRGPEYADLDKLTYLACVIKEAMRVHTVSIAIQC